MEHYKSTLATVAVAMTGLVLTAQILQTGPFGDASRPARPVAPHSEATADEAAWVTPPARPQGSAETRPADATGAVPRLAMASLPAPLLAQPVADAASPQAEAPRKAAAASRRKSAQRPARIRQASLASRAPADPPVAEQDAARAQASATPRRVDPIGDLIRGLGFGRDHQG